MINISCNSNLLTTLDVTNLSLLQILWCPGNNISVLDLSQNSQLNTIRCENNTLHRLDVKNGNNTNVTQFFSTGNPSLECINVDDSTYSANNWTNIDSVTSYSTDCNPSPTNIINQPKRLLIYPNPTNNNIQIEIKNFRGSFEAELYDFKLAFYFAF